MNARNQVRPAFTLLEVLLALALIVVLLGAINAFYMHALRVQEEGRQYTRFTVLNRALLQQMATELRQVPGELRGYGPTLFGDRESITFLTYTLPDPRLFEVRTLLDERLPPQHDVKRVTYFLLRPPEGEDEIDGQPIVFGLARREEITLNQEVVVNRDLADQRIELQAPEIKFIEFRYFDGAQWWAQWPGGPGNSLPQMVRITVGRIPVPREEEGLDTRTDEERFRDEDEEVHPDRETIIVRLPMADAYFIGSRTVSLGQTLGEGR